jgi:hypothetical protein
MARLQGQFNVMPTVMQLPDLPTEQFRDFVLDANQRYDTQVQKIDQQAGLFSTYETAPGEEDFRNQMAGQYEENIQDLVSQYEGRFESPEFQRAASKISTDILKDERWNMLNKNLESFRLERELLAKDPNRLRFKTWEKHLQEQAETGQLQSFTSHTEQAYDHTAAAIRSIKPFVDEINRRTPVGSGQISIEDVKDKNGNTIAQFFKTVNGVKQKFDIYEDSDFADKIRGEITDRTLPAFLDTKEGDQFYRMLTEIEGLDDEVAREKTKELLFAQVPHIEDSEYKTNYIGQVNPKTKTGKPTVKEVKSKFFFNEKGYANVPTATSPQQVGKELQAALSNDLLLRPETEEGLKIAMDSMKSKTATPDQIKIVADYYDELSLYSGKVDAYNKSVAKAIEGTPLAELIGTDDNGNYAFDALDPLRIAAAYPQLGGFDQEDIDNYVEKHYSRFASHAENVGFSQASDRIRKKEYAESLANKEYRGINFKKYGEYIYDDESTFSPAKIKEGKEEEFRTAIMQDLQDVFIRDKIGGMMGAVQDNFEDTYTNYFKDDVEHIPELRFVNQKEVTDVYEELINGFTGDDFAGFFTVYESSADGTMTKIDDEDVAELFNDEYKKAPTGKDARRIQFTGARLAGGFANKWDTANTLNGRMTDIGATQAEIVIGNKTYTVKGTNQDAINEAFISKTFTIETADDYGNPVTKVLSGTDLVAYNQSLLAANKLLARSSQNYENGVASEVSTISPQYVNYITQTATGGTKLWDAMASGLSNPEHGLLDIRRNENNKIELISRYPGLGTIELEGETATELAIEVQAYYLNLGEKLGLVKTE